MLAKYEHRWRGLRRSLAVAAACLLGVAVAPPASAAPLMLSHAVLGAITVAITSHPKAVTNARTARFGWSTSGIVGETRCRIDAHPYTYCPGHPARYSGLADGRHTFTIRVRNGYRVTKNASFTWLVDTVAPSDPNVTGGSLLWRSPASATITASGSSDALSGLAGYRWRSSTDGGGWSAISAGGDAAIKAQGETYVQFESVDKAGNTSAWQPAVNGPANLLRLDPTPPTAPTVVGGSALWQGVASETVTGSGSTDALSGVDHYEYRESSTGGSLWGAARTGSSDTVTDEGERLVQFRAVDAAGNPGPWAPASPGAANTVRIDRSGPSNPLVAGGGASWSAAAAVTVTGSGSIDSGFGVDHYLHRESTDGGVSWSSPVAGTSVTITAEGQTLVQFQSVDTAGNGSSWSPAAGTAAGTVRLDRTAPADPTVGITPPGWQSTPAILVFGSGSTDALAGVDHYQFRSSTDAGATWSPATSGATGLVMAEGSTIVQFRAVDGAGNASAWAPGVAGVSNTVRIDRTPPTAPTVTGGSASWQATASTAILASGSSDALGNLDHYEYRTSTDGGVSWGVQSTGAVDNVTAEGETLVQLRAVDAAGNASAWVPGSGTAGTVRLDRSAPGNPLVSGGSLAWQSAASVTITGSGASDPGGSGAGAYEYRTSTDGGVSWSGAAPGASIAVGGEDETLVQFRATDRAGNTSDWAPASATAASTVRIDRTVPTTPVVSGGSLNWQSAGSVQVTAAGASDGLSGVDHYQYRTSTNGGTTWSPAATGPAPAITAEGETLVQYRSIDGAGNLSAWTPSINGAANTVRLDRSAPSDPVVTGGSLTCAVQRTIKGASSSDGSGSGVSHYEYRVSTDNGATYGAAVSGASITLTVAGSYVVQFRAVDGVGLTSAWAPATPGAANTACIT